MNKNIFTMSYRERRKYRIDELPRDLHEALECLEKDDVIRTALGAHIYERFVEAKQGEWRDYIGQVSRWELERYLGQYRSGEVVYQESIGIGAESHGST